MLQEYKTWIKDIFNRSANEYGEEGCTFFNKFGEELVKFADLKGSETVLDVATGKGAVLQPIVEQLQEKGNVYGIDLSPGMIKVTKSFIHEKFKNVSLKPMDAENLHFPDNCFDTIFCAFAIFFFPNPLKALKEFKRTLKKNGKLFISTWNENSNLDDIIITLIRKRGITKKIMANGFSDFQKLCPILENLGFMYIRFKKCSINHFYKEPAQWWDSLWSCAYRGLLEQFNEAQLDQLKKEAFNEIKAYINPDGKLREKMTAIFIEAKV